MLLRLSIHMNVSIFSVLVCYTTTNNACNRSTWRMFGYSCQWATTQICSDLLNTPKLAKLSLPSLSKGVNDPSIKYDLLGVKCRGCMFVANDRRGVALLGMCRFGGGRVVCHVLGSLVGSLFVCCWGGVG